MRRLLLLTVVVGCGVPEKVDAPQPMEPRAMEPVQQQPPQQPLTGLPCDVRAALQASCAGCHAGSVAVYYRGFSTRDDLLGLGDKVAERLSSPTFPMPPRDAERQPTEAERLTLRQWVQGGMPAGACGALE
ncbi:MAG: hypothetical protein IPJ65_16170 [Archangiaceae bacterium]|nr:hypothetical protein [Archangiaceae bacterium]